MVQMVPKHKLLGCLGFRVRGLGFRVCTSSEDSIKLSLYWISGPIAVLRLLFGPPHSNKDGA